MMTTTNDMIRIRVPRNTAAFKRYQGAPTHNRKVPQGTRRQVLKLKLGNRSFTGMLGGPVILFKNQWAVLWWEDDSGQQSDGAVFISETGCTVPLVVELLAPLLDGEDEVNRLQAGDYTVRALGVTVVQNKQLPYIE